MVPALPADEASLDYRSMPSAFGWAVWPVRVERGCGPVFFLKGKLRGWEKGSEGPLLPPIRSVKSSSMNGGRAGGDATAPARDRSFFPRTRPSRPIDDGQERRPFLSRNEARIRAYSEIGETMHIKRAKTLKPSQIRDLLRVTEATSRHPERDALILLLEACGAGSYSAISGGVASGTTRGVCWPRHYFWSLSVALTRNGECNNIVFPSDA